MKTEHIAIGDNNITYRTCGSGPDILLVHGWISSSRMWENLMEELAPHYRMWALDLIGFGDSWSGDPERIMTIEDQTRITVAFCRAVGIHPHAVIGHSMGASIGIKMALDHPRYVEKLVLVCPVITGKLGGNLDQWVLNPIGQAVVSWGQAVWPQVFTLPQIVQLIAPPYLPDAIAERTRQDLKKATWGASYGALMSMVNLKLDKRLSEVNQEVLLISGAHDETIPPEDIRIASTSFKNVTCVEVETCHHQLPDEDPELFHREIKQFLDREAKRSTAAA